MRPVQEGTWPSVVSKLVSESRPQTASVVLRLARSAQVMHAALIHAAKLGQNVARVSKKTSLKEGNSLGAPLFRGARLTSSEGKLLMAANTKKQFFFHVPRERKVICQGKKRWSHHKHGRLHNFKGKSCLIAGHTENIFFHVQARERHTLSSFLPKLCKTTRTSSVVPSVLLVPQSFFFLDMVALR